ncbi:acyl carrier protein [Kitasatospora sp. NPDC087314]|uniref:acyl carrier protein n=1 Tax=Kitasatospora sp. NPDC087314 TaxID=3364068 RepID=UPI003800BD47
MLVRELRVNPGAMDPGATLEALGLDSLSVVELSVMLSEHLGVRVTEDQIHDVRTLAGLSRFVLSHRTR